MNGKQAFVSVLVLMILFGAVTLTVSHWDHTAKMSRIEQEIKLQELRSKEHLERTKEKAHSFQKLVPWGRYQEEVK